MACDMKTNTDNMKLSSEINLLVEKHKSFDFSSATVVYSEATQNR